MIKKIIILLLLIFILIIPNISSNQIHQKTDLEKTIVYVDDDNTLGPWDGSIDNPYQTIQQGINNAKSDDTIFVYNGTYNENIIINKSINLKAEKQKNPIINGGSKNNNIYITADKTQIKGFTFIQNTENKDQVIKINAENCIIKNNTIINSKNAIYLIYSNNTEIKNNTIKNCFTAIYLYNSYNNKIQKNEITKSINGIYIEESHQNTVSNNNITQNQRGIFLSYTTSNTITQNNFINNTEDAKFAKYLTLGFLRKNKWKNNYWQNNTGIKIIPGLMYIPIFENPIGLFIRWYETDWHPAKQPYNL